MTAKICSAIISFLTGNGDIWWTHFALIGGDVIATIVVGAGIILETPKYSAAVHRIANWLVITGIVAETICSICLFVFDEGISSTQQNKIAARQSQLLILETAVGGRQLSAEQISAIANYLKIFAGRRVFIGSYSGDAEGARFALQFKRALEDAQIAIGPNDDFIGKTVPGMGLAGWGGLQFGIHLQGVEADDDLIAAIAAALRENGQFKIESTTRPGMIVIAHVPRCRVQATQGRERPWRVRRMASMAWTDRLRAVSTTDRMSA